MAGDQNGRPWDYLRDVEEYFLEDLPPDWDPGPRAQYTPTNPRSLWTGDDDFIAATRASSTGQRPADRNPLRLVGKAIKPIAEEASPEIESPALPGLRNGGDQS